MPLAHFSKVGGSGIRTPDLLRRRPERPSYLCVACLCNFKLQARFSSNSERGKDRDMKITGFVYLIELNVMSYVKFWLRAATIKDTGHICP